MKTFFDLVQDVQKPGLCHRCGGCVTFCSAINYGALELDKDGKPRFADMEKCIECGLCYSICPEIDEAPEETADESSLDPMGRVIETAIARSKDPMVIEKATDGGVVTSLLLHLFDTGRIDGAIVTKQTGPFQRRPNLAVSREDIKNGAGFYFDTSHGMQSLSDAYLTYSSIEEFASMSRQGLRRVALVGMPCQIRAFRRMEALGIVPADSVKYCLGLFCSGNFVFGRKEQDTLADKYGMDWNEVRKINVKESFMFHLKNGEIKTIPLEDLAFMRRHACGFCPDYAAEFADISFGGIGAAQGWTSVVTRTPLGRAIFADARGLAIEDYNPEGPSKHVSQAIQQIRSASAAKRRTARSNRRSIEDKSVRVKG